MSWLSWNRLATRLWTRFRGELVGEDEFGNRYYRERGARDWRSERRWVVYAGEGEVEPSLVPPGWHAWLHHTVEQPPAAQGVRRKRWEKPHRPNPSGGPEAFRPPGHLLAGGRRRPATGDYEPWRPEG